MRSQPIPSPGLPASPQPSVARGRRATAIGAGKVAARGAAARTAAALDREILTRIARGGLLICETELRYQLHRRGHDRPDLLELLADLEQRGLIESEIHFRLTLEGAARVPARDRPAARAISSIPWASASAGAAREAPRAAAALRPASPARRSRRRNSSRQPEADRPESSWR